MQTSFLMAVVSLFGLYMISNHNASFVGSGSSGSGSSGSSGYSCCSNPSLLLQQQPVITKVKAQGGFLTLSKGSSSKGSKGSGSSRNQKQINQIIQNKSWHLLLMPLDEPVTAPASASASATAATSVTNTTNSVAPFAIILFYIYMLFLVQRQIYRSF